MAELRVSTDDEATYSVDEALEAMPLGRLHLGVFCACGFAWMVDGMEPFPVIQPANPA
ncbi:hypothetical protein T492DRAFT_884392 [Pavlovales sp. CCMP2436]|nr:hypothetical protein T492DRAFT_884392 [Pavlovales sp. CCMP2436]